MTTLRVTVDISMKEGVAGEYLAEALFNHLCNLGDYEVPGIDSVDTYDFKLVE